MKKFFGVVVAVIGLGLALRFTLNKPKKSATPRPPAVATTDPHDRAVENTAPSQEESPTPAPPVESPPTPEPPRIAGSVMISDVEAEHFATAPGVLYLCEGGSMMSQPKSGGPAERIGDCGSAFDMVADAQGVVFCDSGKINRVTAGTEGEHVVAETEDCIMAAVDGKYAYFVVPGFEGVENPGVYRVARAGGTPEKIFATRPKEQYLLAVDDDALWIGAWSGGTIYKVAKTPGAKGKPVLTGQKGIVSLAVDKASLYWYAEGTGEVRRRKKTGGAVEVIGHDVDQEPVLVADGHAYWFEGKPGEDKRLVHLAPGAAKTDELAAGLKTPSMRADAEGVYVTELDRAGIFMFKR